MALETDVELVTATPTGTVFAVAVISCSAVWSDAPFLKNTSTFEKFSSPFAFNKGVLFKKMLFSDGQGSLNFSDLWNMLKKMIR